MRDIWSDLLIYGNNYKDTNSLNLLIDAVEGLGEGAEWEYLTINFGESWAKATSILHSKKWVAIIQVSWDHSVLWLPKTRVPSIPNGAKATPQ